MTGSEQPNLRGPSTGSDLLLGGVAGMVFVIGMQALGPKSASWWILPPLLGLAIGALLGRGGAVLAGVAFLPTALLLLCLTGEVGLLPCVAVLLLVPTGMFIVTAGVVEGHLHRRGP